MTVQILDEYPWAAQGQGACSVTGAARRPNERVVDIGFAIFDDTPNGDVIISETFAHEIGHAIGMIDVVQLHDAQEAGEEWRKTAEKAERAWQACANVLSSLVDLMLVDPVTASVWARTMADHVANLPKTVDELSEEQVDVGKWLGDPPAGPAVSDVKYAGQKMRRPAKGTVLGPAQSE